MRTTTNARTALERVKDFLPEVEVRMNASQRGYVTLTVPAAAAFGITTGAEKKPINVLAFLADLVFYSGVEGAWDKFRDQAAWQGRILTTKDGLVLMQQGVVAWEERALIRLSQ
jgi:hypothetical protein